MWKLIRDLGGKLFTLIQRVDKLEEHDTEIRDWRKATDEKRSYLTLLVQQMLFEQRQRENAEAERRTLLLELDNRMVRLLPPPPSAPDSPSKAATLAT